MNLKNLGELIKSIRTASSLSQEEVLRRCNLSSRRKEFAAIETGTLLPDVDVLSAVCKFLGIPERHWVAWAGDNKDRAKFQASLGELVGRDVELVDLDEAGLVAANEAIDQLLSSDMTVIQSRDTLNRILVYYGLLPMSYDFYKRYFAEKGCRRSRDFREGIMRYQMEAIRLFSTFQEAYVRMNSAPSLDSVLSPLESRTIEAYQNRTDWNVVHAIPEERLADLGYISAAKLREETKEREALAAFLRSLASGIRKDGWLTASTSVSDTRRRKMSSLLRRFGSGLPHDLSSPLFAPDPDQLDREADAISPASEDVLQRIAQTQAQAERNLSHYLSADYMDVYVATSMRTQADFVSVNAFISQLFDHDDIRPLKLRFFNPTQSWVSDRIAKGLVEALMLRRADFTVYMAQKEDTFGKDSEASVALGQGKPVLVYVPKLRLFEVDVDSESLGLLKREELKRLVLAEDRNAEEVDETVDETALLGKLLTLRLGKATPGDLCTAFREHWADFDLAAEESRLPQENRESYRKWLDSLRANAELSVLPSDISPESLVGILVAAAVRYEGRARVFREVHPLALQVILSTGVLNGILVVRSVESCARLMRQLITNSLELELIVDDHNYRLVEKITRSTIRVISRHRLLANAFRAFYSRQDRHT